MTIDEAIEREKRLAKEQKTHIGEYDIDFSEYCKKNMEEHEQLAEWLEELKMRRELDKDR